MYVLEKEDQVLVPAPSMVMAGIGKHNLLSFSTEGDYLERILWLGMKSDNWTGWGAVRGEERKRGAVMALGTQQSLRSHQKQNLSDVCIKKKRTP